MLFPAEFIARHGTEFDPWPREDSLAYTRWLAAAHYENFQVVSLLLPRRLHQDFFNVYAFCRWADDLGDEMGSPERSLELLAWWRAELEAMYAGKTRHPVFVALRETIERHAIEQQPFADLIRAFVQDQRVSRYETYEQVLDYCVYSANPVGRLVLHLGGYRDDDRRRLSDATCTALQLANHWQDVRRDFEERDRIYLPADSMVRHGYGYEALAQDIAAGRSSEGFRSMMAELVDRAEALFEQGSPLVDTLDRRLAIDVELFSRGGLAVLAAIRRQNYDVLARRPKVGKLTRALLIAATVARRLGPLNATVRTNPSAQ
jgi:squalene synthase HpnC